MTSTTIFDGTKFLILSCLLVSLYDFTIPPACAAGEITALGSYYNGSDYIPMTAPSDVSNVVAIASGGVSQSGVAGGWYRRRLG